MTKNIYIPLEHRNLISISGEDAQNFLQGIITNNIKKVTDTNSIYALMLTPQGKFLYDFFISKMDDKFIIDCNKDQIDNILKKLKMYKLRSDVNIENISDKYEVAALLGDTKLEELENADAGYTKKFCKGIVYLDPRKEQMGARSVIERENEYQSFKAYKFEKGDIEDYEDTRIANTVPSGDFDLESQNSFPHDFGMNQINAIDYNKGCYVGQEVTARVQYKSTLRKKVYKVMTHSRPTLPEFGSDITLDGKKAGKMLSSSKNIGLALLQISYVEEGNKKFNINDVIIEVQ